MKWTALVLFVGAFFVAESCGPGRGVGRRRGSRKLTPLVFKQHVPNVPENTLTASGAAEGRIDRNDTRFNDLVPNYNDDIIFKDEEGTGADRLMTQRCKEKLNTLAISVMNMWPGVKLLVTEGWDEERYHTPDSLHYEGRAVDITTSDRDRSKYGMLARLAVEAGFDWVYYESRSHIHCSVKLESAQGAKYGGCFPGDSTVLTSDGVRRKLSDLQLGERILSKDPTNDRLVFSEVMLFLDFDPAQKREFLTIRLSSNRTLVITPNHLVEKFEGTSEGYRTVFAGTIEPGDSLLVSASDKVLVDNVAEVSLTVRTGVYAPLTRTGTLVVNDVVVSCYATVDSQSLAHWAFWPLRWSWSFRRGARRLWYAVSWPFAARSSVELQLQRQSDTGVHWYAKMLYSTAQYLIPTHLAD